MRIVSLTFCAQEDAPTDPGCTPVPRPQPRPETCEVRVGFDVFADGEDASAGDKGTLVFEGVTFKAIRSQDRDGAYNDAMIFDSDARYASDTDLLVRQGNLLIISDDGDSRDPDDNACGGTIVATFDQPSRLTQLMMVDIEETGGTIRLYDAGGALLKTVSVPKTGDGKVQWVDLDGTENVSSMVVKLAGSGAIGAVTRPPAAMAASTRTARPC